VQNVVLFKFKPTLTLWFTFIMHFSES